MVGGFVPIKYRDFYDIPRLFLVETNALCVLFDGRFDPAIDDYSPVYEVHLLPMPTASELAGDWNDLIARSHRCVGTVRTSEVEFDSTRRQFINASILDRFDLAI
jgi:hypothetical protein